jgi:hypothetical protein
VVEAVFAWAGSSPNAPVAARERGASDTGRNLLFGLLALQNNFIDRDALVAAFGIWVTDKGKSLGGILLARGSLDGPRHALLEALVAQHLKQHGGDPERSLAALAVGGSTRESLKGVGDPDLDASLAGVSTFVPAGGDDLAAMFAVGTSTADGRRFRVLRPHARGPIFTAFCLLETQLRGPDSTSRIRERLSRMKNPRNHAGSPKALWALDYHCL